ncbi:MAG: hypothetical protein V2J26_05925 [Pacificimonas sp.]|jgi:hypothetical protein|nr:hypothetical protein [Pacificimonas sp.]
MLYDKGFRRLIGLSALALASCGNEAPPELAANTVRAPLSLGGIAAASALTSTADQKAPSGSAAVNPAGETGTFAPMETPDYDYPFYMDMTGLLEPQTKRFVRCDESMAAGKHVFSDGETEPYQRFAPGGMEFVYQAYDDTGAPCVYPFGPWLPRQGVGKWEWPDGSQFIWRSAVPGARVIFDEGSTLKLGGKAKDVRWHFEMRDLELRVSNYPIGAVHLAVETEGSALLTAVIRNSHIKGGANGLFGISSNTMLYVENSEIGESLGRNVDQQHSVYLNRLLSSHFKDSRVYGQRASESYGGHQLKDKSYLRIYEDLEVSNLGGVLDPSNRPLLDTNLHGFTWVDGLDIIRVETEKPREALIDIRNDRYFISRAEPFSNVTSDDWLMPMSPGEAIPAGLLGNVNLGVYRNVRADSYRTEPFVARLKAMPQRHATTGGYVAPIFEGDVPVERQRAIALAFDPEHTAERFFSDQNYVYVNPDIPAADQQLVSDRETFIRHAFDAVTAADPVGNGWRMPW